MILEIVLSGGAGILGWSLAEYWIHRGLGHDPKRRNEFSREHLAHHADNSYFAPTPKKVRVALVVVSALAAVFVPLLGLVSGLAFAGGFTLAYAAYEVLHRRLHTHAPWEAYGRWARKHHFHHHFKSPGANHGVTSPLWDLVFGTYEQPAQLKVPRRQAMRWLAPAGTDQVLPDYAADYAIVGRRPG